jgi:hypothetical protein
MPATPYPKIMAMVEGTMEKMFVNGNFHYVDLIPISNGSSWTLDNICKDICNKYRMKGYQPDILVVWIDLERQACGSTQVANTIESSLISSGVPEELISICIPDRMTENIILADEEVVRSEFSIPEYLYAHEGQNGKHALKVIHLDSGISYKETSDGVRLLKKIRLERAAKKSQSAMSFYNSLSSKLKCWWLDHGIGTSSAL